MPEPGPELAAALLAGLVLALTHAFGGAAGPFLARHRRRWTSLGGGISVAYVFLHLLPELAEGAEAVEESAASLGLGLEHHLWLLVLVGLAAFHAVESQSRCSTEHQDGERRTDASAFRASIGSFALYNAIVGYLLVRRAEVGPVELATFALAMLLHFAVNDASLRRHHRARYHRIGRWLLAAAIATGLTIGAVAELPETWVVGLIALLAGGIILNALKEELSVERDGSLPWFLAGTLGYASLLLVA